MKDSVFKMLNHDCLDYSKFSNGKSIGKNYTPDYVLNNNDEYVILEHETEPNRKTILANLFKAAVFLQNKKYGILIIVITPKRNSSLISYVNHCRDYFNWLMNKSNLKEVYFIHMSDYQNKIKLIEIFSEEFYNKSLKLSKDE